MVQRLTEEEFVGKREAIRDWFLASIRNGKLKPGDSVPTRYELTERFSCSRATADFAIQNLIRDKVLFAHRGKGTFVVSPADVKPIDAFALVNCNSTFFWSAEIEDGFALALNETVRVSRFKPGDLAQPAVWEQCKKHRALVFIMPEAEHASYLQDLRHRGVPHLVLYRDPPESSFINIDHRAAGRAMVAALKERGCRRIAWVSRTESRFKTPEERYAGILEGFLEGGLPFKREWAGFFHQDEEKAYLKSLFSGKERPDTVILAHASMGQLLKALQEADMEPGRDIIIANMDEVRTGLYPFPIVCAEKLTGQIGEEAARFLLQQDGRQKDKLMRHYLTPRIIEV